jgi:hypothetical protein
MTTTINSDAILVRLGYSSKTGETATFKIEQAAWEALKANEGKNYVLVLAEVGDDGMPAQTEPKPKQWRIGERSRWVVQRCKEPQFWRFLYSESGANIDSEESAKAFVLGAWHMESRKEFDETSRYKDFLELTGRYNNWIARNAE